MSKISKTLGFSLLSLIISLSAGIFASSSAAQDGKVYELRIYTATQGNLGNLHARFREHTIRIFENHGMKIVGFWSPLSEEDADDTLIYVLEHASQDAADASWLAFGQDPEWKSVSDASNANGPILAGGERRYMSATDYSPLQ